MMVGSVTTVPSTTPTTEKNGSSSNGKPKEEGPPAVILPAGLKNLGNTCYMNSSLQAFRAIPELCQAVKTFGTAGAGAGAGGGALAVGGEQERMVTYAVRRLFDDMDTKEKLEVILADSRLYPLTLTNLSLLPGPLREDDGPSADAQRAPLGLPTVHHPGRARPSAATGRERVLRRGAAHPRLHHSHPSHCPAARHQRLASVRE